MEFSRHTAGVTGGGIEGSQQNRNRHVHLKGHRNVVSVRDIIEIGHRESLVAGRRSECAFIDGFKIHGVPHDDKFVLFERGGVIAIRVSTGIEIGSAATEGRVVGQLESAGPLIGSLECPAHLNRVGFWREVPQIDLRGHINLEGQSVGWNIRRRCQIIEIYQAQGLAAGLQREWPRIHAFVKDAGALVVIFEMLDGVGWVVILISAGIDVRVRQSTGTQQEAGPGEAFE